jgi:fructokinase
MLPPMLARFISTGEALTDFIRTEDHWIAKAGGAGWNVARVVARLGLPSASAVGLSHDLFGDELFRLSVEAGLEQAYIQRFHKSPPLAMVTQSHPPHYFFIRDDSADLAFDPAHLPSGWLEAAQLVHFSCLSLLKDPLKSRLLELAHQVKAAGKLISYDPNYRQSFTPEYDATLEQMTKLADFIKVSDEDLCGLFRTDHPKQGLEQLRRWNQDAPIMLTKGADGADLHLPHETLSAPGVKVEVVDTVGAGDACMGGLAFHWLTYPDAGWDRALEFAVAAGAAACTRAGAYAPSQGEIEGLLRSR